MWWDKHFHIFIVQVSASYNTFIVVCNSKIRFLWIFCLLLRSIWCLVLSDYELLGKKVSEKDLMLQYRPRLTNDSIYGAFLKKDQAYDMYEKDIAVVHVYFESPTVIEFQKQQTMTEYRHNMHLIYTTDLNFWNRIDFVAQMGGILGLCLGFSIISGFEIVYWLLFHCFK